MNIAFDMSFTQTESHERTVGKFAKRFIRSIQKENPNDTYHSFYLQKGLDAQPIEVQLKRFLNDHAIDLFQILSPFDILITPLKKAWFGKTKVAVLLHDMIPFSEFEKSDNRFKYIAFIQSCDLILTNGDRIRQEAIRTIGVAPEQLKTIYAGADKRFKHNVSSDAKFLQKHGIVKPFILSTTNVFDTKYVTALLRAFGSVNSQLESKYQLVFVGKLNEAEKQFLLAEAKQAGAEQDILWLPHVSNGKLAELYNGAEVFVFPSAHLSYSTHVLDAMSCGTPVLSFSHASTQTRSDDAAYQVDIANPEDIVRGLMACLTDEALRSDLRSRGYDEIDRFDWHSVGAKVQEAYQVVLRKKLAIFAPLTPLKTGIANYMNIILPSLQTTYECDLFIDGSYEPDLPPEIGEELLKSIYTHDVFEQRAGQYDEVLFQLGNSSNHTYMIPYLSKYPGVVVLHDLHLNKLSRDWMRTHGEPIDTDHLLLSAKSIIVHNQYAQKKLQSKGFRNVGICTLPHKLPVMISLLMDRDFIFSSFGRIEENKHLELAIRCFKRLRDEGHTDMRYTIVGDGSSRYIKKLKAFVGELGLDQMVEFKGFVAQTEYQTTLSHSDACIQLRYPTDGESSGSLLDVLSHGKAAIVSDVDSFSELPSDVVCKVNHDDKVEDQLFIAMRQLYKDKNLRKQMRQRSRNFVAEHHPISKYVEKFKAIVEDGEYDELREVLADEQPEVVEPQQETFTEAIEEVAAEPQEDPKIAFDEETIRTLYIHPNRYRRVRIGKRPVSYFSFNLNELPQGCTIQSAVMQIPTISKVLRIHRIKSPWSIKSVGRRNPTIRKYPIFRRVINKQVKPKQSMLFTWDCTQLAQNWLQDQLNNHGVYVPSVSAVRKPRLHLVVSGKFE